MSTSRREFLSRTLAALSSLGLCRSALADGPTSVRLPRDRFGTLSYCYGIRAGQEPGFDRPERFIPFCREQGFGGVQMSLKIRSADECRALREQVEKVGAYVEGMSSPPKESADIERFEAELRTAKECGAKVLRTVLSTGRRYEIHRSIDEYRAFKMRAWEYLQRAEPIVRRLGLKLAVENHKDYRADELLDVIRKLGSEHIGVCLDTGNNIALLEDPWQVIDTLAPVTMTVHLKDMAVEESADGFLLAEVPLGEGFLDIPKIIDRVSWANPQARFNLEMMTRDPLRIPCFTDEFWSSMDGVPGVDLGRSMRMVKQHARPAGSLVRISQLAPSERVTREAEHVRKSVEMMKPLLVDG
jgi:sugar phosphate isomerase/epimerase